MSKNIDFVDLTTVVPADMLDDVQEVATGAAWGIKLTISGGTTVNLAGDPLTENQYSVRVGAKPRYGTATVSVAGGGGAGNRDIFVTSANVDTPKAASMELQVPPATPAAAYYRKVGELTWSGAAITNLRLTNAVQANADQVNSFVFTPFLVSSTPLTVRGLASQSADILRVEDSTQTGILRVTPTGVIFGSVTSTGVHTFPQGTVSAPSLAYSGDLTTGIFSPGAGRVAITCSSTNLLEVNTSTGILIGAAGSPTPIVFGGDVSLNRGAANRLDLATGDTLNLVNGAGSLLFNGTALNSTHLSDSAALVRTTGVTFTGNVTIPAGTALSPSFTFTGATTSGMYSPSSNVLGLAAGGVSMATLASTGIVNLPQAASGSTYLQLGSGVKMYSGSGSGVSMLTTDALTVLGQDLEVRKSNGVSRLILSRPDGTRVAISFDNANAMQITQLP